MFDYDDQIKKWKLSKKYDLLCSRYIFRKKIMRYFFSDLDSTVMDKDCLYMIDNVETEWFERLCFEDRFIYNRMISDKEKISINEFNFDPLQRIEIYYAKTMEMPFYDKFRHGRVFDPSLTRDYLFTDKERLDAFRSKCTDIPYKLMIEHIRDISNDEFVELMCITQPMIISFMMGYFFKVNFAELCDLIRKDELSGKIFKKYKYSEEWSYVDAYNLRIEYDGPPILRPHYTAEDIFTKNK